MFIICAVIYVVGGTIDIFCLTAEIQPWAKPKNTENSDKIESKSPQTDNGSELKTAF